MRRRPSTALVAHYRGRGDLAWGLARVRDHAGDVLQQGDLLRLADRELLRPLDGEARRVILKSAKRVSTVTALSPIMWIAVGFVLVENVRMFRAIAGLYGGRPGVLGALRLARLVVGHVIATGGIAMTDDLLGQFVGQDVLRRLSRRLGEGAFNGALTARLGVVAVEVTRPLPYLDTEPLRMREIFGELVRSLRDFENRKGRRRLKLHVITQAAAVSGRGLKAPGVAILRVQSRARCPASMKTGGGVRSSFVASAQRSIGPALSDVSQLTGPASTRPSTTGAIHARRPGDTNQTITATIAPTCRVPARKPHGIGERQSAVVALLRLPA